MKPNRLLCLLLLLQSAVVLTAADCTCDSDNLHDSKSTITKYKAGAIAAILTAGAIGVCLPFLSRTLRFLRPESDLFFVVKAFAAGVILSTGFIHILPDAFENLTSPCLSDHPWGDFPFAGFGAMCGALGTLMIDAFATGYYQRAHFGTGQLKSGCGQQVGDEEHAGHVHVHTHATHGHAHGASVSPPGGDLSHLDYIRYRVTSQVLELGIVVHSVIIGISLGTSQKLDTIKPLVAALSFHQFFEGIGLGGCISQAKFKGQSMVTMALFFSLTTPVGIAIGIGIMNVYNENSPTALIVQGLFNSLAAGILVYMSLVDLLAADFMSQRIQSNARLQLGSYVSLLLGAGFMSLLAKWA